MQVRTLDGPTKEIGCIPSFYLFEVRLDALAGCWLDWLLL
jgi:hypothetical protein